MSKELNFRFERFEEYYGDIKQVKKLINQCKICGNQLVFTHLSDYKNMIVQETAICPECDSGNKKVVHVLN